MSGHPEGGQALTHENRIQGAGTKQWTGARCTESIRASVRWQMPCFLSGGSREHVHYEGEALRFFALRGPCAHEIHVPEGCDSKQRNVKAGGREESLEDSQGKGGDVLTSIADRCRVGG